MDEYEDNITLEYSLYWLSAIECQGTRVVEAMKIVNGQHYPFLNIRTMEEHFFLVACEKARRWVEKLEQFSKDGKPLKHFIQITNDAKIVRNKREHDDEYFGTGKQHAEEPSHCYKSRSGIEMNVGTSCSDYSEGTVLLGGIVDVNEVVQSAKFLHAVLQKLQHEYWDKKAMREGDCDHFKIPDKLFGA